jgi:hypothetical protein
LSTEVCRIFGAARKGRKTSFASRLLLRRRQQQQKRKPKDYGKISLLPLSGELPITGWRMRLRQNGEEERSRNEDSISGENQAVYHIGFDFAGLDDAGD